MSSDIFLGAVRLVYHDMLRSTQALVVFDSE